MGTTLSLDTPEAIGAWIEERRKRWPSKNRLEDKQRRLEEAVERGQLDASVLAGDSRKRKRVNGEDGSGAGDRGRGRGRGRGSGDRGRGGRGRGTDNGWKGRPVKAESIPEVKAAPVQMEHKIATLPSLVGDIDASSSSNSNQGDDDTPEVITSKAPVEAQLDERPKHAPAADVKPFVKRPAPKQPKRVPENPFAQRPSLMRSVRPFLSLFLLHVNSSSL
jgi:hypothetical protein